jgi:hypothetical protein
MSIVTISNEASLTAGLSQIVLRNSYFLDTVTYRPNARQQLSKHIPTGDNAGNNRKFIARKRINKHASLTIKAVFSVWSLQSGYKEVFGSIEQ